MICRTCPRDLSAEDIRLKCRRCEGCRAASPGNGFRAVVMSSTPCASCANLLTASEVSNKLVRCRGCRRDDPGTGRPRTRRAPVKPAHQRPPVTAMPPSWWVTAPAIGFMARAIEEWPRMRTSRTTFAIATLGEAHAFKVKATRLYNDEEAA